MTDTVSEEIQLHWLEPLTNETMLAKMFIQSVTFKPTVHSENGVQLFELGYDFTILTRPADFILLVYIS